MDSQSIKTTITEPTQDTISDGSEESKPETPFSFAENFYKKLVNYINTNNVKTMGWIKCLVKL